jgi:hypothetical protein
MTGTKTDNRDDVYFNLHKKVYSIRGRSGFYKGRVRYHAKALEITYPTFVVQPAGRAKVLKEKRKNVHAFVRGLVRLVDLSKGTLLASYAVLLYIVADLKPRMLGRL